MDKTLVERLREPSISEGLMKTWDWIRRMIAEGDKSSYPRDIFESVIDGFDEERREAAARIEKLERENQAAIEAAFASNARIEKLEAALRPFADVADLLDAETEGISDTDELDLYLYDYLAMRYEAADFRTARAALNGE